MVAKKTQRNGNGTPNGRRARRRGNNGNGNGSSVITRPMVATARPRAIANASAITRPIDNRVHAHSGTDFIGVVRVKADVTTPSARILTTFPISPSAFPGTRMTQFSQLYEMYKFKNLRLRYVPAVPTTLACQLVLYVDLDPTDDPNGLLNADTLIRQATAQTGSIQWNFHAQQIMNMPMRSDQQFFFTGNTKQNARFSHQGRAYLIQVTDVVNFNGDGITSDLTCGSLYLDWSCQFNIPQLNPAALTTNLFTTDQVILTYTLPNGFTGPLSLDYTADNLGNILNPLTQYAVGLKMQRDGQATGSAGHYLYPYDTDVEPSAAESIATFFILPGASDYGVSSPSITITTDAHGAPEVLHSLFFTPNTLSVQHYVVLYIRPLYATNEPFALPPRVREVSRKMLANHEPNVLIENFPSGWPTTATEDVLMIPSSPEKSS